MSLDIDLMAYRYTNVGNINITHNLGKIAEEAGIYKLLWRPEEIGIKKAKELIKPLEKAIDEMVDDPDRFKKHNPPNGWGTYEGFLCQLRDLIKMCIANPDADILISR